MEKRYILVTRIEWDTDNEKEFKELPQEAMFEVTEDDVTDITDINEIDDYVSEHLAYLSSQAGFSHRGFDMRIYYDTIYGKIYCVERYDADNSESFYDMYDENGGIYYGELHRSTLDGLTARDIEEQIELNR